MIFKIALCQMPGVEDKNKNMETAEKMVREAAENGAEIISLPEIWPCLYSRRYFRANAETEDGPLVQAMSRWAKENGIYLVGGSIPLLRGDDMYNTCFVFSREGEIIAVHDKAHMFDIAIRGGITFKESDSFTQGDSTTTFETEYGTMGVEICFDVRFPELARKTALEGAKVIFLPAAFNMTTGPAHWQLSMRARALDNQVYFAACSPARDENGPYVAYGHSLVASPWGDVKAEADEKPQIVYCDIDTDYEEDIRQQLPLLRQRRPELY
ncbi:MAG: carbon-nitrogen hydrolase family protein [Eubacteriaceae bacterium]|jgi:predicted amidohydrolase|nr:carbon-nitrogen hydrolase family protein [Eubacteriaceae bacterium]